MGTVLTNQKPQHSRTTATRRRRPPPLPPGPRELCPRDRKSRKRSPPANPGDTSHPQCLPMARNRRECLPTPRVSCHSTARDNVTEVTGAKKKGKKKKRQPLPLRMTNFWPALQTDYVRHLLERHLETPNLSTSFAHSRLALKKGFTDLFLEEPMKDGGTRTRLSGPQDLPLPTSPTLPPKTRGEMLPCSTATPHTILGFS